MTPFQAMRLRHSGGGATDPYFANVVALLHLDGSNGGTVFTDETGKTWAAAAPGVPAPNTSTTQQLFGPTSLDTGPSRGIATADHTDWDFGSGDWTIELAFYSLSSITQYLISKGNTYMPWAIALVSTGEIRYFGSTSGTAFEWLENLSSYSNNVWTRVAMVRVGTSIYMFKDGTLLQTVTGISGALMTNSNTPAIANDDSGTTTLGFNGYIDEVRITKGVGRYTSNYTLAAAAFPNS